MINEKLIPQYKKWLILKQTTSRRQNNGIGSLPLDKTVCHLCKTMDTTAMTCEIHHLGLNEVARLTAEMEKVKKQVGFEGTLWSSSSM
jgi:uncharacterized protein (DUF885 family)